MWQEVASHRLAAATIGIAIFGVVLSVASYGWFYLTGPITSLSGRLLGMLAMSASSASPFLISVVMAYWLSNFKAASVVLLCGTCAMLACAVYAISTVVEAIKLSSHDGQLGFALVLIHIFQWIILGASVLTSIGIAWVFRKP
jgi:hypothetical protein